MITARRRAMSWAPAEAAASIAELAYVERAITHIAAGWAVKVPAFDTKLMLGQQMHRSMERASLLKNRVNGLCYATAADATVAGGWQALMARIDAAPCPELLAAAVYRWLYPRLVKLYRTHVRQTDSVGDRGSIELIEAFLVRLEQERRKGLILARSGGSAAARMWIRELDTLWEERLAGEPLPAAEWLWKPLDRVPKALRPERMTVAATGSLGLLPDEPVHDPRGVGMFLHKELDEEFTTLELIARNSYEHPDMPWAFHRDMARQVSDEARHAMIIMRLMKTRGIRHGDFPLSTSSFDGLYQFEPCKPGSRRELLWRILIRQTFDEGLAIDSLAHEIERRRSAGQADLATAFEYILRDEVFHAQSGLRWSRELAGSADAVRDERGQAVRYFAAQAEVARERFVMENLDQAMSELAAVEEGKERRGGRPPERPVNRVGRAQAGFDEEDIRQVVSWGFASEDR